MKEFPLFMKNQSNRVPASAQNTEDIEGYYYDGPGGGQMAFWTYHANRVSQKHVHDFDEYFVVVAGQFTACFEDKEG
ncbi:MAG: cupin, partial [Deltaproteobacteria bacterium]|nr:cupin [Deltaproteobacteria bacterium]